MEDRFRHKAYVVNFGRALAEELRPFGIRMTTLCPGGIRTEFMDVASQHVGDALQFAIWMPMLSPALVWNPWPRGVRK
ncbi:MAG TPA: hypothetical protein VFK46_05740 [Candidatus Macondimonas sp.]|nr:hypothetical protein [Candidatus Macondimonas sp.]